MTGARGYCNTLQYPATHCNTLQYPATHCNTLHHTHCKLPTTCAPSAATHCNTLQQTRVARQLVRRVPQRTATNCNMLQHTATHEGLPTTGTQSAATLCDYPRLVRGTHIQCTPKHSATILHSCAALAHAHIHCHEQQDTLQLSTNRAHPRTVRGTRTYAHTRTLALIHMHTQCQQQQEKAA